MISTINELKKMFLEFEQVYAIYLLDESNLTNLKISVKAIEDKMRQLLMETNFPSAQKIVHDIAILLPTNDRKIGKFDSGEVTKYINGINELIETVKPGAFINVGYDVVAVAPGSSILLCDFDTKAQEQSAQVVESIDNTKNALLSILKNSTSFSEPGNSSAKLKEFCEETKIDQMKAYKISKTLSEMFPDVDSKIESVKLIVNNQEKSFTRDFNKDDRLRSIKTKKDIYQEIKPADIETITGVLGIMEEWEENHKISIIESDTFKVFTTNYEPSNKNIEIIKRNIGSIVTIQRSRSPDDKRKWFLDEWTVKK